MRCLRRILFRRLKFAALATAAADVGWLQLERDAMLDFA